MMIIWSGLGFLIAVIGFGTLVLTELISESITGDEEFYQNNGWVILIGMLVAALITFVLDRLLTPKKDQVYIEKDTGKEVVIHSNHSLFFIPMKWWPLVFIGLGIVLAIIGKVD